MMIPEFPLPKFPLAHLIDVGLNWHNDAGQQRAAAVHGERGA